MRGRLGVGVVALAVVSSWFAAVQPVAASGTVGGRTGLGYVVAYADGYVAAWGDVPRPDVSGPVRSAAPIVGIATLPGGQGFALAAADAGVFTFGKARFYGSMAGTRLHRPIVAIAYTPTGRGYYLVAADGGIFTFGDAVFRGSAVSVTLRAPVVGIAMTRTGRGYWLVGADGGVFTFGDAVFRGSAATGALSAPIVGIAATSDARGYWLAGRDAVVYPFGDAPSLAPRFGSHDDSSFSPIVAIAASPTGRGYLLLDQSGGPQVVAGDAPLCPLTGPGRGLDHGLPLGAVAIAIPFDAATVRGLVAGSCAAVSPVFRVTSPWHVDIRFWLVPRPVTSCSVSLYRGPDGPLLARVSGGFRLEVRSAQMAGAPSFRIVAGSFCLAIARPGSGGSQRLPFTATAGDSLPFASASPITIDSATQPQYLGSLPIPLCHIAVLANSDGHRITTKLAQHVRVVVPAGNYFLRSDLWCNTTVK
jgi:hypothetical protein